MISNKDFGAAVFQMIRSGVPELNVVMPRSHREQPIDNELMLHQRRDRARRRTALAMHWSGRPIRNPYPKRGK